MKKTIIIYHSKTGTTKKYAEEIDTYLRGIKADTQITTSVVVAAKNVRHRI